MEHIMNPRVRFTDVRKSYDHNEVLKGISFEVFKGYVVALIGQSGSGKSTALRCIIGLEKINGGALHVCGLELHAKDCDLSSLPLHVCIVFQSYKLFPTLSLAQNITM